MIVGPEKTGPIYINTPIVMVHTYLLFCMSYTKFVLYYCMIHDEILVGILEAIITFKI